MAHHVDNQNLPREESIPPPANSTSEGTRVVIDNLASTFLSRPRAITVWVPPAYHMEPERRFPVLYVHDGQHVLESAASPDTASWGLDRWITRLAAAGDMDDLIVAAIDHTGLREQEYDPAHSGRNYARFVIEELKPEMDRQFRTLPDRTHTAVAGASMGGLVSLYFAWVYPHIFGAAACLSSPFSRPDNRFMLDLVKSSDITPDIRLYLYCGGGDEVERPLLADHRDMKSILADKGLRPEINLRIDENMKGTHGEASWSACAGQWLPFLFPAGGAPVSSVPL